MPFPLTTCLGRSVKPPGVGFRAGVGPKRDNDSVLGRRLFHICVQKRVENCRRHRTIGGVSTPSSALHKIVFSFANLLSVKVRLDKLLVDRGLAQSRERAQALVLAGQVLVNEQKVQKPGTAVPDDAVLRLLGGDLRYVSRGGLKLEAALDHWRIDVHGRTCLDVGASTGGFTDCLLQHGAARVIAVDTGYGQLDYRLRQDPRVTLREKTNARHLKPEDVGVEVELVVVDVSFISATLVLPAVVRAAFGESASTSSAGWPGGSGAHDLVVLVKPQFEAGREYVEKGGIVRDPAAHQGVVDKVRQCVIALGAEWTDVIASPILGMEGNREFLLYARFPGGIVAGD